MNKNILEFIFSTFEEAFSFMRPSLSNYGEFSQALSKQVQIKENDNIQYSFDIELDELIKKKLKEYNISGRIFSEESGFFEFGDSLYRVVYDPFCNSSLASRTFHEAAVGISIFSYDYVFITSAIMDYQTGIVGLVEDGKSKFYQVQSREETFFEYPKSEILENAWVVITLENRKERANISNASNILHIAKRIIISSGHIYWLKLATGAIDVYLDPFGGERLYEMFACTVAQYNGCFVSDKSGKPFDPVENLKIFENNPDYIYYPIAATHLTLHQEVLKSLIQKN